MKFTVFAVLGILLVFIVRMIYVQSLGAPTFTSQRTDSTLAPPKQAATVTIKKITGSVKKFARDAKDFAVVDIKQPILQGEIVAIENHASFIGTLDDSITITAGQDSEIEFANLIPSALLFRHRRGEATYESTKSLSVRSGPALIELTGGVIDIEKEDDEITLSVQKGNAKLAVVGVDNETHVWELQEKEKAVISGTETTVYTK